MSHTETVIAAAYAAFNRRDVDGIFALMNDHVHWPKASEGGSVVGKDEIRAYWTRQWSQFDPHVEPVEIIKSAEGKADVRVRQVVKSLDGDVLSDTEVWHIYTLSNGRIDGMVLGQAGSESDTSPSEAFHSR